MNSSSLRFSEQVPTASGVLPLPPTTPSSTPHVATVSDAATVVTAADGGTTVPPADDNPPASPSNSHGKFPFMMITLITIVLVIVFGGSYLYFNLSKDNKTAMTVQITPPATDVPASPTVYKNPFVSPTLALENPFASPTAVLENPFGTYDNPFTEATNAAAADGQAYTNPFESLK